MLLHFFTVLLLAVVAMVLTDVDHELGMEGDFSEKTVDTWWYYCLFLRNQCLTNPIFCLKYHFESPFPAAHTTTTTITADFVPPPSVWVSMCVCMKKSMHARKLIYIYICVCAREKKRACIHAHKHVVKKRACIPARSY